MRPLTNLNPNFSQENQWEILVREVETRLKSFYSVPAKLDSVLAFYVRSKELRGQFGMKRAATLLVENEKEDSLEISWYVQDDLREKLLHSSPLIEINQNNLDLFTVLTEEISHVILLMHRASLNQPVSAIELELQSELDKVILSSQLLFEQGHPNQLEVILRSLFDSASFSCADEELVRYKDSNKIAAQFWFRFCEKTYNLDKCLLTSQTVKMFFMKIYRAPFEEKINLLNKFMDYI